ncbi:hypothetical protein TNCV_3276531 [Trichonephila clavipes]|nr:hypothetical protein TNCV_3276531 [Trichonephila clavipes]
MIKVNRRITIDGLSEELGIGHERAQKMQSPEFFLEGFLKPIKCCFKTKSRNSSAEGCNELPSPYLSQKLSTRRRLITKTKS